MRIAVWGEVFSCRNALFCAKLWRALMHQACSVLSATGPKSRCNPRTSNVQVVFDDHHRMALLQQRVEGLEQFGDVVHVQARGGFVKHKQGVALSVATGEEGRQFDALRFATTQGVEPWPSAT